MPVITWLLLYFYRMP